VRQTRDPETLLKDFAFRSFFEIADGDYIAARTLYRAKLLPQFLSASQQALEKYLKYILLLNRIHAQCGRPSSTRLCSNECYSAHYAGTEK
jgi:HEPN domain-containing protein